MSYFTSIASNLGSIIEEDIVSIRSPADRLLAKLWECGWWQVIVFNYLAFVFCMQGCWPMLIYTFLTTDIPFRCKPPDSSNHTSNQTSSEAINLTLIRNASQRCEQVCLNGYEYFPSNLSVRTSIITEWDLVCDKSHLVEISQTVFMAGNLIGAIFIPGLSDRHGRKSIHIRCQIVGVAAGILIYFVESYSQYVILKFIEGLTRQGVMLTGVVWCLEFVPTWYRSLFGIGFELYWTFYWCVFSLMAYLIRDWRHLQLVSACLPLISISLIWLAPESPSWLIAKHKYKTIKKIFKNYANKVNRTPFPEHYLDALQATADSLPIYSDVESDYCNEESKRYGLLDMSHRLSTWTVIMSLLWFQNFTSYYGQTYLIKAQTGNIYLNFILSGLIELPAYIGGMFILHKLGRRWPLFAHQMLAGTILIACGFTNGWISIVLNLVAKYSQTFCFATLLIYTPEIYPTTLRGAGLGVNSMTGQLAGLILPHTIEWYKLRPWIPTLIYGILGIVVGCLGLLLPETMSRPMPETMNELEHWNSDDNINIIDKCCNYLDLNKTNLLNKDNVVVISVDEDLNDEKLDFQDRKPLKRVNYEEEAMEL